jgi:hypothetical protein
MTKSKSVSKGRSRGRKKKVVRTNYRVRVTGPLTIADIKRVIINHKVESEPAWVEVVWLFEDEDTAVRCAKSFAGVALAMLDEFSTNSSHMH